MKAILMSIRPEWVAKILNGEKTLEVRKSYPKSKLPIEVYIYCTKGGALLFKEYSTNSYWAEEENKNYRPHYALNGKVVGYFTLNKVSRTYEFYEQELLDKACLSDNELFAYLKHDEGYAWHIDNLVVFDKPKELSEFYGAFTHKRYEHIFGNNAVELDKKYGGLRQPIKGGYEYKYPLTRAPQSWCYVEV